MTLRTLLHSNAGLVLGLLLSMSALGHEPVHEYAHRTNNVPAQQSIGDQLDDLIAAANVLQAGHQFDDALALLERALLLNPRSNDAWLMRASIHSVQGNAEQSVYACGQLRQVPIIVRYACRGRAELAAGARGETRSRLAALLDFTDLSALPPEINAWAFSVAGDLAVQEGDSQTAIRRFESSLSFLESTQVRAALIDVLINEADFEAATSVLAGGTDELPLQLRRFIVAKTTTEIDEYDAEIRRTDAMFRHWIDRGDFTHAREMARFYLDVVGQPERARYLAAINYEMQREPEDLLLVIRSK